MRQVQKTLVVATEGPGLTEITRETAQFVAASEIATGLAHLFCRHTSASLLIQENADPDVQRDLVAFFRKIVPEGDPLFIHRVEGPDDMPAHVKSALTATALTIPFANGKLLLGMWQGIYLFEHRARPHRRSVVVHLVGE
jgi:secondary thiamine-phosphate synthase enzyme